MSQLAVLCEHGRLDPHVCLVCGGTGYSSGTVSVLRWEQSDLVCGLRPIQRFGGFAWAEFRGNYLPRLFRRRPRNGDGDALQLAASTGDSLSVAGDAMSDREVKMQTVLRLAGEFHRAALALDGRTTRSRQFRKASQAAEWYAGYRLQQDLGWSDETLSELGFPLEPR